MSIRLDVAARVLAIACCASTTEALAAEDPSPALIWNCAGCHGPDGVSAGSTVPSIAGMDPRYFIALMRRFGADERWSTDMDKMRERLEGLSDHELAAVSAYYGQVDALASAATGPAADD